MSEILYPDILHSVYHIMVDGKQYNRETLLPLVQKACAYTDEQMAEMTKGGISPRVREYVAWAITHLYGAGLISKVSRGVYEIVSPQDHLLKLNGKDFEGLVRKTYKSRKNETTPKQNNTKTKNDVSIAKVKEILPQLFDKNHDWMLHCVGFMNTAPNGADIRKGIRSLLVDAEEEISIEELQELLKEAIELRKIQYELVVKMKNKGNKKDPKIIVDFTVKDDRGKEYPLRFESLWKAIYLTFLYLEGRTSLMDFCNATKKPNMIFQKIYNSLYNKKGTVKAITFESQNGEPEIMASKQEILIQNISRIRSKIAESLPNDRVARQFVIADKEEEHYFSIMATNQSIREAIKKTFNLK